MEQIFDKIVILSYFRYFLNYLQLDLFIAKDINIKYIMSKRYYQIFRNIFAIFLNFKYKTIQFK